MASSLLFSPPPSPPLDPSSSASSFRPFLPPKPSPPFSLSSFFGDSLLPHRLSLRKEPPSLSPSRLSSSLRDSLPGKDDTPAAPWHVDASRVFLPSDGSRPSFSAATTAVATAEYAVAEEEMDVARRHKLGRAPLDGEGGLMFPRANANGTVLGERREEELFDEVRGGTEVTQIGLSDELVSTLVKRGITRLFPIQEAVLGPAMEGRDIIGRAKTGTGKTLAFGIPIIQRLLEENENKLARRIGRTPRALVLAPTRELAVQVEKEFMESAPSLSTVCVYGGVSILAQQRKLERGVDVAVGTPGRIIDLLERRSLNLKDVRYMVLDEADQMLAVGFEEDVEKILEELPLERQSMLFSATMPVWVKKLSRKFLDNPLTIDLVGNSDEKLAEGIKMFAVSTVNSAKRSILSDLITVYGRGGKTIVFTQTKKDADDVSLSMSRMLGTEALHGDISQAQREKTLNGFRSGKFTVLVATDVAARGLDIPNVDLVIHYEIPNDPETFVHRSGRTGRAGKHGITILMHTEQQIRNVRLIERDVGCKFECISPPSVLDVLQSSSQQAEEVLSKVHPELRNVFLPTAERLLEEQGPEALAAAIAQLSGFTQPPPSRSLITHEEGLMTLQMSRFGRGSGVRPVSARNVLGTLSGIFPFAADAVGKIRILAEREVEAAIFDLPEETAKELLTKELPPGVNITVLTKLPRLVPLESQDKFGRFPSRGSGGSGGRSDWGGRGRRQNERSSGWQSDLSGNRFHDFDRMSRSRSSPKERVFSGACFICGESGHRAAECPDSRRR